MIYNKIVVRYQDGRINKGATNNFSPEKESFHLTFVNALPDTRPTKVSLQDLKAVFFVKTFGGNPKYKDKNQFNGDKIAVQRKIKVTFKDGEVLMGTSYDYKPGSFGFFIFPADSQSNIERCFIISASTKEVSFI
jgi:hypothetical protein